MDAVNEIKSRLDIVDLVSETVKLRRSGKNYTGFCPFHSNTRTPAFVVFPDTGTWRCFGQCNEGGDIFGFVMKKQGWDFPEALSHLADRAGVVLEPQTPERKEFEQEAERLHNLLEEALVYFQHHLLHNPAGKEGLVYLEKRGLEKKTIESFGLGYGLNSWDALLQHFLARGFTTDDLLKVGLITERSDRGGYYDRFRNRIVFPIRDRRGRMAGFGARVLNPEDIPKFINSPQTMFFDKGKILYGLDLARKAIREEDQVVIVEGYMDVILPHQAGFKNTVSPMGTALTEDQLRQLKRLTRRIVLALDADAAGEKATLRGLEVARQSLDRSAEFVFDARGLLHQEARLQADLRVTTLPEGMDPDEIILRDPEEWRAIIKNARPVVAHVMQTLAADKDLEDPKIKSEIAAQVLPLINDVPDSIERDAYRQQLARLLQVDERSLLSGDSVRTSKSRKRRLRSGISTSRENTARIVSPARRMYELELHILRLLLRQPDILHLLDRNLQTARLLRLDIQDFEQGNHQSLLRIIQSSLEQDHLDPQNYILESLPIELTDLVRDLRGPISMGEPIPEKLLEDLLRSVVNLRLERVSQGINQIRFMQEELQDEGEYGPGPYMEMFLQYQKTRDRLDKALQQTLQLD